MIVDVYIEVNDDSNNVNEHLWNKGNCAAINEELERIYWESMFEGQTIVQCYGTFLNVANNFVELYVPLTTSQEEVVSA